MSTDFESSLENRFPLPNGITRHRCRIGDNPLSALFPVPVGDNGYSSDPREEFQIHWEDQKQGLKVLVRAQENGHLLAEVFCTNTGLPDKTAVSVALIGAGLDKLGSRAIPLGVPENGVRTGSRDLGTLSDAVKELGPQLGVGVILIV